MTATKDYFIHLISSYINEQKPVEPASEVNWEEILRLATIHSVQVMTYLAVEGLQHKPSIYNDLKNMFMASVNISTRQEHEMKKVIKALNKAKLKHILFKGYLLRNLYPNKEARTFGDIDFLINREDREKCHRLLLDMGYTFDKEHYEKEVWTYTKGVVSLEVHTAIIHEKLFNDFDYVSYFVSLASNCNNINDYTYELTKENHFIYILVHLAKHFYNAGVGVRMMADVAVYIKSYGAELDWTYLMEELKKIKLFKFAETVLDFCRVNFETQLPVKLCNQCSDDICEYILNHGVFGFDDKNVYEISFSKGETKATVFDRIFISYEEMQKSFVWFSNCPKWLLPYGWIRRGIWYVTNKNKRRVIGEKINALKNTGQDSIVHKKLMEELELVP